MPEQLGTGLSELLLVSGRFCLQDVVLGLQLRCLPGQLVYFVLQLLDALLLVVSGCLGLGFGQRFVLLAYLLYFHCILLDLLLQLAYCALVVLG